MSKKSVWALIFKEGKLLFTKRSDTTSRPGQWCPPGGGIHVSESPEEACAREVREEVGLAVEIEGLLCEDEGFLYFQCTLLDQSATVSLSERECSDFRWVAPSELLELGPIMDFGRMQRVFKRLSIELGPTSEAESEAAVR